MILGPFLLLLGADAAEAGSGRRNVPGGARPRLEGVFGDRSAVVAFGGILAGRGKGSVTGNMVISCWEVEGNLQSVPGGVAVEGKRGVGDHSEDTG